MLPFFFSSVIPAKAGIQWFVLTFWIPAGVYALLGAGMTGLQVCEIAVEPGMKFQLSVIAFMMALLFGCASPAWNPGDHHVAVERVSSEQARISRVYMLKKAEGIVVAGELRPGRMTRATPPGHVVVEVIGSDGTTVERVSAHYRRIGKVDKPAQRYAFSVPLAGAPPAGSTVRVIHDDTPDGLN